MNLRKSIALLLTLALIFTFAPFPTIAQDESSFDDETAPPPTVIGLIDEGDGSDGSNPEPEPASTEGSAGDSTPVPTPTPTSAPAPSPTPAPVVKTPSPTEKPTEAQPPVEKGKPPAETPAPLSVLFINQNEALTLPMGGEAKWTAEVRGGIAPYSFVFSLYLEEALFGVFPTWDLAVLEWTADECGVFTVSVTVTDAAGNEAAAQSQTLTVLPMEETAGPEGGTADAAEETTAPEGETSDPEGEETSAEAPDPLSVSMVNPRNTLLEGLSTLWQAQAKGGAAPYTYAFSLYAEGEEEPLEVFPAQELDVFQRTFEECGLFTVSVTVTDADGQQATAQSEVLTVQSMDDVQKPVAMAAGVDITSAFTDPDFLAGVRKLVGKNAPEPILSTDVSSISLLNVYLFSGKIKSLAGIEHFTGLNSLWCHGMNLTSLPTLPSNLKTLWCYDNQL